MMATVQKNTRSSPPVVGQVDGVEDWSWFPHQLEKKLESVPRSLCHKHTWQFVPLCSAMWAVCICPNNQSISLNSSTVFLRIFPSYSVCICPSNQQHFFDFFNSISLNLVKHISKIQFLLIFQQHFFDYFPAYSKNDSWQRKKPPVLIMDEEDAGLSFNFSFFHQSPDYSFACKRMGESESGFSFALGSQPLRILFPEF